MKRLKPIAILALCLVSFAVLLTAVIIQRTPPPQNNRELKVNGTTVDILIANNSAERSRGLCCRDSLPSNSGMLFIYDRPGDYRFWMKDSRISLDMFWISGKKIITHIETNVKPESYPKSFGTNIPSQYILETNSGFADRHNIKVGDQVQF